MSWWDAREHRARARDGNETTEVSYQKKRPVECGRWGVYRHWQIKIQFGWSGWLNHGVKRVGGENPVSPTITAIILMWPTFPTAYHFSTKEWNHISLYQAHVSSRWHFVLDGEGIPNVLYEHAHMWVQILKSSAVTFYVFSRGELVSTLSLRCTLNTMCHLHVLMPSASTLKCKESDENDGNANEKQRGRNRQTHTLSGVYECKCNPSLCHSFTYEHVPYPHSECHWWS